MNRALTILLAAVVWISVYGSFAQPQNPPAPTVGPNPTSSSSGFRFPVDDSNMAAGTDAMPGAGLNANAGNLAIGKNALNQVTVGYQNTAVGFNTLTADTTGFANTAFGWNALAAVTTGGSNTAIGARSAQLYTGLNSLFVGYSSGSCQVSGDFNTYVGAYAGQNQDGIGNCNATPLTGSGNTALGEAAMLTANGSASYNTAIGANALFSVTGDSNTAVGYNALKAASSGQKLVAVGVNAALNLTTATDAVCIGFTSCGGNVGTALTGNQNTVVGSSAGRAMTGTSGFNTLIGYSTGLTITTGSVNTLIGNNVGSSGLTTGQSNVWIGTQSNCVNGNVNSTFLVCATTGSTHLLVGNLLSASLSLTNNGSYLMPNITSDATLTDATVCVDTTNKQFYFGSGALGVCLGTSSIRYKHGVKDLTTGLEQIMGLQPVSYYYDEKHGDPNKLLYGFTAEQGETVLPDLVAYDKEGKPNSFDYLGVVPVLVKAVQEQQREIEALKARLH